MALSFGIMIEGQEGLTWPRWQRLARTVEDAGYDALFRSDHLTGVLGDAKRPSLETWACLTWLATGTSRIRFGPCVSPLTFYQPAVLAKRAAAIADLSGGRFDLGIGAGWHEGEHAMFGIPFPPGQGAARSARMWSSRDPRPVGGPSGHPGPAVLSAEGRRELPAPARRNGATHHRRGRREANLADHRRARG